MTGAEAARFSTEGRLAAACVAVPLSADEHRYETYDAALWIAAMVRLGVMLHPEPKGK